MGAPEIIRQLTATFADNLAAYKSGRFNEAQVRIQFINPMFEALGWDVANRAGYAEAYKEVVHEDALRIGGAVKAPDYCFRIGGARKFFLEAKKPAVNIREDVSPAYQLRRYAWSAKLPLSILTDFEEFAVYDCRVKPVKTDKASTARVMYFRFEEYPECWGEIAAVFARESILKGAFDRYAESHKKKRGTAEVDDAFLAEIEAWRESLARNIALRNPALSQRELNHAVQQTIDRIIFLRIAEDRGIEDYGRLMGLQNGKHVYKRLFELFRKADAKYNSGLFHFHHEKGRTGHPDELTPSLAMDDKALTPILKSLYFPDSPYEFSVLPADILGQVYEQFLGKVIRLTAGHRAVVEDKPEVKKAGGVYYTPTYIVDYIVRHTVGKLLEGKTPRQAAKLRICDPACGSGSFLLGAYQCLLDWHLKWYGENDPEKWAKGRDPKIYQVRKGEWRLTTSEKKRILTNNIYGVDIDQQAVEVTKLSLLLKVLENETEDTLGRQMSMFHERALPDLAGNIKCGNSLIGPDFYDQQDLGLMDEEERFRINVFDWQAEFPDIFTGKTPGFDAVIGNPPYVLLQDEFRDDAQIAYYRSRYTAASYKLDTYHLFMEKGLRLTAKGGRCSMITPANFLTNNYLAQLRKFLLQEAEIEHILVIDGGVFDGISVDNAIFVVSGGKLTKKEFPVIHTLAEHGALTAKREINVSPRTAMQSSYALFTGAGSSSAEAFFHRIYEKSVLLGKVAHINFGKQLRNRKVFQDDVIEVKNIKKVSPPYRPCYTGRDVTRYWVEWSNLVCLDDEVARSGGCWDRSKQDAKRKLLTRQIGRYPEFAIDEMGYQCLNTMFMISVHAHNISPYFVLGVLNSKLTRMIWLGRFYDQRRTFPKIKGAYLQQLPIHSIDPSDATDKARHDRMVALVERMLSLHKQLAAARTGQDKTMIQRQIDATDRQIDRLVYELYDLTDEEIAIVEEATKPA